MLVCPPFAAEAPRNYGREVTLSQRLASENVAALRFHYRGSGHSDGEGPGTLEEMEEDARAAIGYVKARLGDLPVALVGTRLGAVVAIRLSNSLQDPPLALWDPVVDPDLYLKEIMRARLLSKLKDAGVPVEDSATDGTIDVVGYPLTPAVIESLRHARLDAATGPNGSSVLVVELSRRGRGRDSVAALVRSWRQSGSRVETRVLPVDEPWWFGASGRGGMLEVTETAAELVPLTVGFLRQVMLGEPQ